MFFLSNSNGMIVSVKAGRLSTTSFPLRSYMLPLTGSFGMVRMLFSSDFLPYSSL